MKEEKTVFQKFIKIFSILAIITALIIIYGHYINPTSLTVKEIAVKDKKLNNDYNGFKIAHFSDIHYGRTTKENNLKKVINSINELNPDVIIFTGDLFDFEHISEKNKKIMIECLSNLDAKLFKFAIIGDYDTKYLNEYKTILEESNFIILDNSSKLVYYNSSIPLNFIGLTNTNDLNKLYNNDYYNITLIHKPDEIKNIDNSNLVFAGHSLGGQIKLPFIGGIRKKEGAYNYIDGYYEVNNKKLYISNGIGTEDISFRFYNTPSITLYRLYNK